MGYTPTDIIWHDGEYKRWQDATVHILAHAIHYGSSVFEGVRAYETPRGPAVFRNRDHAARLFNSAKIYGLELGVTVEQMEGICREIVVRNGLKSAYIRPFAFRGEGTFSLCPGADSPTQVAVAAIEWGAYLGRTAIEEGIDVCVSSWCRLSSAAAPILAKAGGHYLNAQLIAQEAQRNGFAEGIALDHNGNLSEGSSENLFVVRDGRITTPPLSSSVLDGITRDTVVKLAHDLGYPVVEQTMPRDALYVADEIFLTGTAAEITPVRSVDRRPVGPGTPGPITKALQDAFFGLFTGQTADRHGWLDYCTPRPEAAPAPAHVHPAHTHGAHTNGAHTHAARANGVAASGDPALMGES